MKIRHSSSNQPLMCTATEVATECAPVQAVNPDAFEHTVPACGVGDEYSVSAPAPSIRPHRRRPVARPPTPTPPAPVEICRGPAFGAPAAAMNVGFTHWWIRHGHVEVGMGEDLTTADPVDAALVDHRGLGNIAPNYCVPVAAVYPEHADVDGACVDRGLRLGEHLGEYVLDGVCSDVVERILVACDPSSYDTERE